MATFKKNRFDFARTDINEEQGQLANFDTPVETSTIELPKVTMAKKTHKGEVIGKNNTIALSVKPSKEEWQEWTAYFKSEMRSLNKGIINAVNEYIKAKKLGKI